MSTTTRRGMIGALAASGATLAATSLKAMPEKLDMASLKKDTDVACLYHCDFGDPRRFSQMLRNMHNHYSAYEFDPFKLKLVTVVHSAGLKFFLEDLSETPWEKGDDRSRPLQALRRPDEVRGRGVPVPDRLQAAEHRSGQDAQGSVPQIRAVGRRRGGGAAEPGLRLFEGGMSSGRIVNSEWRIGK
jgi:intracellular sulfur oxidation DsrE/DsrF family protein